MRNRRVLYRLVSDVTVSQSNNCAEGHIGANKGHKLTKEKV